MKNQQIILQLSLLCFLLNGLILPSNSFDAIQPRHPTDARTHSVSVTLPSRTQQISTLNGGPGYIIDSGLTVGTPPSQAMAFRLNLETSRTSLVDDSTCVSSVLKPHPNPFNCFHTSRSSTFTRLLRASSDIQCHYSADIFHLFDQNNSFSRTAVAPFCLSVYITETYPYGVDAILGLGAAQSFSYGIFSFFEMFPPEVPRYVGLQLAS